MPFKSGFVAILGRPNAGKSTLLNALLSRKLSIISSKPQTTRHKILGLLNAPQYQICFLDTPGLIEEPKDPLQKTLKRAAVSAAYDDADILLLVAEPSPPSVSELEKLAALARAGAPLLVAINKTDLEDGEKASGAYAEALKPAGLFRISALKKTGLEPLLQEIVGRLPESPPFYDPGQISDRWERFFASELVREQIFALYSQEIPHAVAVVIESFREKPGRPDEIKAALYVEKDTQKGILIGAAGRALRELTARSQASLDSFLGRRTRLELWIKVRKNWRRDPAALKEFGYHA